MVGKETNLGKMVFVIFLNTWRMLSLYYELPRLDVHFTCKSYLDLMSTDTVTFRS